MTIHLVRHGRTRTNAEGRLLGRADPPLDPRGVAEAEAVAAELASMRVAPVRVVSSPLLRARATADAIAAACGLSAVEIDDRWIELNYGEFEGVALTDVPAETWARWRSDATFTPPGGESLGELGERVRAVCAELAAADAAGDVVVVSHVSPIKAAAVWALDVADEATWRMYVAPASLTRIGVTERGPVLRSFNETGHLGGGGG